MRESTLEIITKDMAILGIEYALGQFKIGENETPPDTYFVGEYQEIPGEYESGLEETEFILTGWTTGTQLDLERAKEKIKKIYPPNNGKVAIAEDGSAVAIFYANGIVIPSGGTKKKIEINLSIKEWSVS